MKKLFALLILIASISAVNAQKIVLKSGSLDFLKGEKAILIEYDYSNMRVGKFDNEQDYVDKKVAEYNESEAGKGDKWKENWIGDRKARFEPKFEELINKYLEKADVVISQDNSDAKYKMIVKTVFTEPGFNVGVMKRPSMVDVEVIYVEVANPDNELAVISSKGSPGETFGYGDFDTGLRISESYAKCGKSLGGYLWKKVYK